MISVNRKRGHLEIVLVVHMWSNRSINMYLSIRVELVQVGFSCVPCPIIWPTNLVSACVSTVLPTKGKLRGTENVSGHHLSVLKIKFREAKWIFTVEALVLSEPLGLF